jgi:hypothetical protein
MRSFPLPVRVAAGLAATAVEQTRQLPTYLLGLPVTLASQALQVSMRIQQQMTELAIKGDEALSGLGTAEEQPAWATFDEDEPAAPAPSAWDRAAQEPVGPEPVAEPVAEKPAARKAAAKTVEQSVLPDYDQQSLPQLRGKLRGFSEADLVELLKYERAQQQRPEFERMLSNRLDRLRSQR